MAQVCDKCGNLAIGKKIAMFFDLEFGKRAGVHLQPDVCDGCLETLKAQVQPIIDTWKPPEPMRKPAPTAIQMPNGSVKEFDQT